MQLKVEQSRSRISKYILDLPAVESRRPRKLPRWFIPGIIFFLAALLPVVIAPQSSFFGAVSIIFVSIVLEAIPFLLLGSFAGGMIEEFISRERITKLLPANKSIAILTAAGLGILVPVCECAIVPVTRRLVKKGVPFSVALAYLIAAPSVNPLTITSTSLAYAWNWDVAVIRLVCGYSIGALLAFMMDKLFPKNSALLPGIEAARSCSCGCGHSHSHHDHRSDPFGARFSRAMNHGIDDFLQVGQYFIAGAFLAAVSQAVIPEKTFVGLSSAPGVSIILMMGLAVVLNLCSEADAFVAASFRFILPLSSQMAFMVLGAMLDIKLAAMYLSFVRKRALITIFGFMVVVVFTVMMILHFSDSLPI
jgi:uncharacterized membrane protein YraQ (UPF0718 family)